jgi:hypothetical protein
LQQPARSPSRSRPHPCTRQQATHSSVCF